MRMRMKKNIAFDRRNILYDADGQNLDTFINLLAEAQQELKKLGAIDPVTEVEYNRDDGQYVLNINFRREETKEETEKKEKNEKLRAEYKEERERKTLAELKAKYE